MIRFFFITFCFLCLCGKMCFSQTTLLSNTKYQLETGTYLSTSGITPFWLRSNQYGVVPLSSPILTFRGSAHKEYDSTKNENQKLKKFGYGYGFWGVVNVAKQSRLLLPEAYIKVRYGAFEFYGGRRREIMGLVDTTLTSGSYIWSGNAMPMPKIQISIPNYTSIIGHGLISVKGSFAHGWFNNQPSVKNYYLHQKTLYGRIGREMGKINIFGGITHLVQWGGTPKYETKYVLSNGKFPSSFYVFLYSLYPSKKLIQNPNLNKYFTQFDTDNRVGNQVGSVDLAIKLNLKQASIMLYRQFPMEVGQLRYLTNADDGLYGLSVNLKNYTLFNHLNIEYLFTSNQGTYLPFLARLLKLIDAHPGEAERYFNHDQYYDGWTYNSDIIGTPLIMNDIYIRRELRSNLPYLIATNNMIKMVNIALTGRVFTLDYKIRTSISGNFGEPRFLYKRRINQTSFNLLLTKSFPNKKLRFLLDMAGDSGGLIYDNIGAKLGVEKFW